jgi:hypothetical protein
MAALIEDVSSRPGRKISDQAENPVGEALRHPGSADIRQISADDVAHNTQGSSDGGDQDDAKRGDSGEEGPRDGDEDLDEDEDEDDRDTDGDEEDDEDDEDRDSDR